MSRNLRDARGTTKSKVLALGLTERQYTYWLDCGLIKVTQTARGSGHRHGGLAEGEEEILPVMADLVRLGFRPRDARKMAEGLAQHGEVLLPLDGDPRYRLTAVDPEE